MSPGNSIAQSSAGGMHAGADAAIRARSQGQIIIILAIAMVPLLGFVGLAVDLGTVVLHHRQLQNGVDAAAHAGMQRIARGIPSASSSTPPFYTRDDVQSTLNTYVDANVSTYNLVFANLLWGNGPDADDCLTGMAPGTTATTPPLAKIVALSAATVDDLWTAHCLQVKATHNYSTLAAKVLPGLSVLQVDAVATAAATPLLAGGNLMPMAVADCPDYNAPTCYTQANGTPKKPWSSQWTDENLKVKTCAQWAAMKVPHVLMPDKASDGLGGLANCTAIAGGTTTYKYFLHDDASDVDPTTQIEKLADTSQGAAAVSKATNTVDGPTAGVQVTNGAGGTPIFWLTPPFTADTTISGNLTVNLRMMESNSDANVAAHIKVHRASAAGAEISEIVSSEDPAGNPEIGTSEETRTWSVAVTTTTVATGERLKITVLGNDRGNTGGNVMEKGPGATQYTFALFYDGPSGGSGDSWISYSLNTGGAIGLVSTNQYKGLLNFSGPPVANAAGEPQTSGGAPSSTGCHWDNEHSPSETSGTSTNDRSNLTGNHRDWRGFNNPPGQETYAPFPAGVVAHSTGAVSPHPPWNNKVYRKPTVTTDQPMANECTNEAAVQNNALTQWIKFGFNGIINTGFARPADYAAQVPPQPLPTVCPDCGQGDFFMMFNGDLGNNIASGITDGPCAGQPSTILTVPLFDAFADPTNVLIDSPGGTPSLHLSRFAGFYVNCSTVGTPSSELTGFFVQGTAASGAITGGTRTANTPTVSVIKFVG